MKDNNFKSFKKHNNMKDKMRDYLSKNFIKIMFRERI